ncbi:MAG: alpha/beta fold hydrolase [Acidimicrobiia bacterium]|nr:alpha/beta fold hydrolase [Acidimicrobiia bacterium]
MSTSLIEVAGVTLRVEQRRPDDARGVPLLLIPGIGAPLDLFEPFCTALGARATISFDPPGVGESSTPALPRTMAQLADLVAALVDRLGHDTVDVLGLSWGGALAQEFTLRHPRRVNRLVLVATMHGWTSLPGDPLAMSILATPLRYYSASYLRAVAPLLYGGGIRHEPGLLDRQAYLRQRHAPSLTGYTWQLAAVTGWSSRFRLGRIASRTLVLAGDDDPIINVANAHTMARLIPDTELVVLERGGHLFLLVRAEETAAIVDRFLNRSDGPTDGVAPAPLAVPPGAVLA